MPRIRSIHPEFWTDEDIVEASAFARLLLIGLGIQADDKGIFPWKPKTLKMRCLPGDDVDVSELLVELEGLGLIMSYEMEGKKWGAIKNFRKHQRPKSPNDLHPITEKARAYVGLISEKKADEDTPISEGLPQDLPRTSEIGIQMEDGGGGEEEEEPPKPPGGVSFDEFWMRCPHKLKKVAAQKAWRRMSADARQSAFDAVSDFYEWFARAHPQASPLHPSSFLNGKRWLDEGWKPPPSANVDKAAFWANSVLDGTFVSRSTCPPELCREMIQRGLVTEDQIKARGLVA